MPLTTTISGVACVATGDSTSDSHTSNNYNISCNENDNNRHYCRNQLIADIADKYFATINPIARKIQLDIVEITNAYEHLWDGFSQTERTDVINETLIKPEIVLKYFDSFLSNITDGTLVAHSSPDTDGLIDDGDNDDDDDTAIGNIVIDDDDKDNGGRNTNINSSSTAGYLFDGKHLATYVRCHTGWKQNQDDVCGIYRDEHSLPFSYKTKSQLNFSAFFDMSNKKKNIPTSDEHHDLIMMTPAIATKEATSMASPKSTTTKAMLDAQQKLMVKHSAEQRCHQLLSINKNRQYIDKDALPLLMFNAMSNVNITKNRSIDHLQTNSLDNDRFLASSSSNRSNGCVHFLSKLTKLTNVKQSTSMLPFINRNNHITNNIDHHDLHDYQCFDKRFVTNNLQQTDHHHNDVEEVQVDNNHEYNVDDDQQQLMDNYSTMIIVQRDQQPALQQQMILPYCQTVDNRSNNDIIGNNDSDAAVANATDTATNTINTTSDVYRDGGDEEDDEKLFNGEYSLLLEQNALKKGYDFLNNW